MSKLELKDLESATVATEATTAKAPKVAKEVTPEEVAALGSAVEKIQKFGVSEDFAKVLPLVTVWHLAKDDAALVSAKTEAIEAFGGSDKFKDYIDGEFQAELAVIAGLQKAVSILNNVKSFYARREGTKKVKTANVNIGGTVYEVNAEYLQSLAETDKVEKRELLLAHADTKPFESTEIL